MSSVHTWWNSIYAVLTRCLQFDVKKLEEEEGVKAQTEFLPLFQTKSQHPERNIRKMWNTQLYSRGAITELPRRVLQVQTSLSWRHSFIYLSIKWPSSFLRVLVLTYYYCQPQRLLSALPHLNQFSLDANAARSPRCKFHIKCVARAQKNPPKKQNMWLLLFHRKWKACVCCRIN